MQLVTAYGSHGISYAFSKGKGYMPNQRGISHRIPPDELIDVGVLIVVRSCMTSPSLPPYIFTDSLGPFPLIRRYYGPSVTLAVARCRSSPSYLRRLGPCFR